MTGTVQYRDGDIWRQMRVALFRSVPMAVRRWEADHSTQIDDAAQGYPVAQVLECPDDRFESGEKIMAADLGRALFSSPDEEACSLAVAAGWELASEPKRNVA